MRAYYFFMKFMRGVGVGFTCAAAVIGFLAVVVLVIRCLYFA